MSEAEVLRTCRFNDAVGCDGKTVCGECGWNPRVREARIEELRRQEIQREVPHVSIQKRHKSEL